jgi:raffinose/stachyose/melibiose transport system permease protein
MTITTFYPFFMILLVSFKSNIEFQINPLGFPQNFDLSNYVMVFKKAKIPSAFLNSFTLTSFSVIGEIFLGSLAAYALTKMKFKKAKLFASLFLAPMVFPIFTVIIPLYLFFRQMHLLNNMFGLVLIYLATGLPLVIFIFTSFMSTIPYEISEAAIVDGASHFRIFYRIILPLIKPAIATTVVISGLNIWNDFFLPLMMITNNKLATLPLKLYTFKSEYATDWPSISTCIVYLIIPIIVAYVLLQKHIISGIVAGSVKG